MELCSLSSSWRAAAISWSRRRRAAARYLCSESAAAIAVQTGALKTQWDRCIRWRRVTRCSQGCANLSVRTRYACAGGRFLAGIPSVLTLGKKTRSQGSITSSKHRQLGQRKIKLQIILRRHRAGGRRRATFAFFAKPPGGASSKLTLEPLLVAKGHRPGSLAHSTTHSRAARCTYVAFGLPQTQLTVGQASWTWCGPVWKSTSE